MTARLFTYGTLQPGYAPDEMKSALAALSPVSKGFVRGLLYDLGEYPGAVLDPSSDQKIYGTVFELPGDGQFLRKLDEYEEFDRRKPGKSLFRRTFHPVTLVEGPTVKCWLYEYNREPGNAPILKSGRYTKKRRRSSLTAR